MNEQDMEALLATIMDDSKPLPGKAAPPAEPAVAPVVAQPKKPAAPQSDEDFLNSLMNGPDEEIDALLAAQPVTQGVTEPEEDTLEAGDIPIPRHLAAAASAAVDNIFADSAEREEGAQVTPLKMPTFAPADFAATIDIRNFATLVTLNTARWHAKVKSRQASKDAANATGADEASFESRKRLLVGADSLLKEIHKAIDEARASHYTMTLPWSTTSMSDIGRRTGGRLLPNTLFVEYMAEMHEKKEKMLAALNKFIPEYPNLIEAARKKLGKSFDAREYPNVSSIRSHFDLSFDFQPIPKGNDFAGLPQQQLDALARKVNSNTQVMAEHAMQEVWLRLHTDVGRMAERLSSPDKVFHDSLVQNVKDTARLAGHLNVTQDAKVEAIRKKVEKHLCVHDAKELRSNPVVRTKVAAMATSIIQEMDK